MFEDVLVARLDRWRPAPLTRPVPVGEAWVELTVVPADPFEDVEVSACHPVPLHERVERCRGRRLVDALTEVAAAELADLDADDRLAMVEGWDLVAGWVAAQQRTALAAFAATRGLLDEPGHDPDDASDLGDRAVGFIRGGDYAADEVAAALSCSSRAAESLLAEAVDLVRWLPGILHALADGRLTLPGARAVLDEAAALAPERRHLITDRVLTGRGGRPASRRPDRVRRRARRAVLELDPHAGHQRHERAKQNRCVRTGPSLDGMAHLDVYAAVTDVAVAFENLDARARDLAADPAESRGIEAIRADLAIGALAGTTYLGDPADLTHLTAPETEPAGFDPPRRLPGIRAEIVITAAETTLAGLDDQPGQLPGYGPVTAQVARALAAHAGVIDTLTLDPHTGAVTAITRQTLTSRGATTGAAVTSGAQTDAVPAYSPPAATSRYVIARDRTCRYPGCNRRAQRCDLDHTVAHPKGATCPGNLGALCRHHHQLKQTDGWHLAQPRPGVFVWTTPTGRTHTVEPPDPLEPD